MLRVDKKQLWEEYCQQELGQLKPILSALGFELDEIQVHIGGERYLSNSQKLVLVGRRVSDGLKVIIKVANDSSGIDEIRRERQCREMLGKIKFAYHVFFSPEEILYKEEKIRAIFITKYIEQDCQFLDRPIYNQFFLALKGLEVQEGLQVTTYEHAKEIGNYFGIWSADDYWQKFSQYHQDILAKLPGQKEILDLFSQAETFLSNNKKTIALYSGFLTHWDFVPHNIRVKGNDIYLLDHSSIRFGNKYEGWARFINFMTLYNPELADDLLFYVQKNRPVSEYLSLRAMRVYRLAEIIWHYANTLDLALGDLKILNQARIDFWLKVLSVVLGNKYLDAKVVDDYRKKRDSLRSQSEKDRQKNLH